ncbi:MAG TPA: SH3 domain-containing protein [Candidatus Acidoferrales bacterium]|nr:SH3 domain-containing protein [Candidatus Acidoferrales bacterium]
MIRKLLVGFVLVLVVCVAAYLRFHHPKRVLETAYVGNHQVILWNTSAQIREPLGTVNYGDRVDVLARFQEQVQVHTADGRTGWITQSDLLSADLWQKAQDMESKATTLPVEARGHTRVLSNLHVEPGRDTPRIRQVNKSIPVDMFQRQPMDVPTVSPAAPTSATVDKEAAAAPADAKKEDWWLVRAHMPDQTSVSGWVLGRFIDLDVPAPLPDYASSAGVHIAAWFELNRVSDSSGNAKSQYLLLGTRGPEGQPCDFTLIRVYTWDKQRERYETAFVDSELCGKLPVKIAQVAPPVSDATFSFEDWSKGTSEQRIYRMHQTVVRRVRQTGLGLGKRHDAHK